MSLTVPALSLTACPLTVCTPAKPLRVRSEVSNAIARGGGSVLLEDDEEVEEFAYAEAEDTVVISKFVPPVIARLFHTQKL